MSSSHYGSDSVASVSASIRMEMSAGLPGNHRRALFMEVISGAFGKVLIGGKKYYTCNVAKLRSAAHNTDTEQEVSNWIFEYFQKCIDPYGMHGIIFSIRPGQEVLELARDRNIERIYLMMDQYQMVEVGEGEIVDLTNPLVFTSLKREFSRC